MEAIFTNLGTAPVPIGSTRAAGFLDPLEPNSPYSLSGEGYTVVTVGDNPSFKEELKDAFQNIYKVFERIVLFWREHARTESPTNSLEVVVNVRIENKGPNDLRVILGNNTNDTVLVSGGSADYLAPEYIEVRELGV